MNPYNLSLLIFSFCSFFVGLLVLLKRNDETGKLFFVFSMFVTGWSAANSWMFSNDYGYQVSLQSTRTAHLCACFITSTWLHFVLTYLGIAHKRTKVIQFAYIFSFAIASFTYSPWYIPRVKPIVGFQYYTDFGPIYVLYAVEFVIVVSYGFFELVRAWRNREGEARIQLGAFLIAAAVGFISGSLTFVPVFGIPLPQYNLFVTPLYPFLMAFAIMKRGSFDSEEILAIHKDKLALLGLMSSSINHEIKNPLFLLQEYVRKLKPEKKGDTETFEKMSAQISRMSQLVNRLTEFGKPSSGKTEEVDLKQVIDNAIFFASQELKYRDVEVKLNFDSDLPALKGDKSQFEEIFLNLIVNAYHAMPKGGMLTIEVHQSQEHWRTGHGSTSSPSRAGEAKSRDKTQDTSLKAIEITISDTGVGIPKEDLKSIFKPFYTTKAKEGTGLGLYIVKTLVEQNRGRISVTSEVGKGTRFLLRFLF